MRLEPGTAFPNLDLPDHTGRNRRLAELAGGDPVALRADIAHIPRLVVVCVSDWPRR